MTVKLNLGILTMTIFVIAIAADATCCQIVVGGLEITEYVIIVAIMKQKYVRTAVKDFLPRTLSIMKRQKSMYAQSAMTI